MPIDDRPLNERQPFDQRPLLERIRDIDISTGDVALGVGVAAAVAGLAAVAFSPPVRAAAGTARAVARRVFGANSALPDSNSANFSGSEALSGAEWDADSQIVTLHWTSGDTS